MEVANEMTAITEAMSTVVSLVPQAFTMITGNAYAVVMLGASLVGLGISFFHRIKRG